MTKEEFIEKIAAAVIKYAPQYGIKVYSPIIAQACLESAYGTSNKAKYNNFFGIKYRKDRIQCYSGTFVDGSLEQLSNGTNIPITDLWYKFATLEDGVQGYFQFINISRYDNLKGVTDPLVYLTKLKEDGYATSLDYVAKNMSVINTWNLTKYDIKGGKTMVKVAIDAGHGSETSGKRTPDGYREHWANVKVANYFAQAMDRCGVSYIKTGWNDTNAKDDVDISLSSRQTLIKNAKCDYSISFHFNASGDGKTYNTAEGIETLISDKYPGDSLKMAQTIHAELIKGANQKNRGVKTQSLAMCNCNTMKTKASILIECAFMTNSREAQLMQSESFCKECAEETAKGFCNYIGIPYIAAGTVSQPVVSTPPVHTVTSYVVKVTTSALNIRKGPGTSYAITGTIKDMGRYTIIEESNGWGKLKSGAGWISLKYTQKV